ncbi:MAG: 4-hydroxy-tetrahydrodipicolinate reductase, partial [Woeseiaceae bacterium]|nr:4-hydroxy-tetrahydrodipicolinate reductase [Woeseiaceae bacterium]
GTATVLEVVTARRIPLVCGVSGLGEAEFVALDNAADVIPVVYDRNMSRGIAALNGVLTRLVTALGPDYSMAITETHHVHKKDAPSGTALMLGETLAKARRMPLEDIPIASERRGDVPGEHTVTLSSTSENLALTHAVTTRDVFAEGAVFAAEWVVSQPSGRYSMQDVLFSGA